MHSKLQHSILIIIWGILLSVNLQADSIHFITDNTEVPAQTWHGEVLTIANDSVRVRFTHQGEPSEYIIHVSRILSIYFDNNYEHTFPIRLRPTVSRAIPGNLTKLRRLYLFRFNENIDEEFDQIKIYGPHGNRSIKANIIKLDKAQRIFIIKTKTRTLEIKNVEGWELSEYIRAWVR